jgi:hypothetical protein
MLVTCAIWVKIAAFRDLLLILSARFWTASGRKGVSLSWLWFGTDSGKDSDVPKVRFAF